LRAQNEDLRRVASVDWDIETENALLRERLVGVAAEVLQLSSSFGETAAGASHPAENGGANGSSGNGSEAARGPDAAAQNGSPTEPPTPTRVGEGARPLEGKSLAERLRALQQTAARH
jgi:hypothetical protein